MDKLLSICMMVKDEEKNLERCLYSLKPILDSIDSELIIVDTGSTDQTIEISKSYTSNVYFHKWNNNFSDMRNITISYAKGEWILIIDADEVLETPDALINLLCQQEINQYNTIRIYAKNILLSNNSKNINIITERLFRNDGSFHYKGAVHNQPIYNKPIFLASEIELTHYGYINDDKELMEKKFNRTATLLKQELEKNPENIYYLFQLGRSYCMYGDDIEGVKYLEQSFELLNKVKKSELSKHYYVIGELARVLFNQNRYLETIDVAIKGIFIKKEYIDLYYFIAKSYLKTKQLKSSLEYLKRYRNQYISFIKNHEILGSFTAIEIRTFDENIFIEIIQDCIKIYTKLELDFDEHLIEHIQTITNESIKNRLLILAYLYQAKTGEIVEIIKETEESEVFAIANIVESNDQYLRVEEKFDLVNQLSMLDTPYGLLNKLRVIEQKRAILSNLIKQYDILQFEDKTILEIVSYAIEVDLLIPLFKRIPKNSIRKITNHLIHYENMETYLVELINSKLKFSNYQNNEIFIAISEVVLLNKIENNQNIEIINHFFNSLIKRIKENFKIIYNFNNSHLLLDNLEKNDEKFYMTYILAEEKELNNNLVEALTLYNKAVKIYPYYASIVKYRTAKIQIILQSKKIINDWTSLTNLNNSNHSILSGTIEIANQLNTLSNGLRELNYNAHQINYFPNYLKYNDENEIDLQKIYHFGLDNYLNDIFEIAKENFNIFHFHYGHTLLPDNSDLKILNNYNKKIFMHHWGTDIRIMSLANKYFDNVRIKDTNEDLIKRKLEYLSKYIGNCIVADDELRIYANNFYENVYLLPQAIKLEDFKITNDKTKFNKSPLVVHAPTSTDYKGTREIQKVIEELKVDFDFEFVLVQNMSHEKAKEIYINADIIIDQIFSPTHGLLSIEAMALKKPVICSISEYMLEKYPKSLPIVNANEITLKSELKKLLEDREYREILGAKGRRYVEKYHDYKKVAAKLIEIYDI